MKTSIKSLLSLSAAVALALGIAGVVQAGNGGSAPRHDPASPPVASAWRILPTERYAGKRDDVAFADARHGWYGTGKGDLFASGDGGASWSKVASRPGTFIRALGFVDARTGFIGNVGTGYYPGVTDTVPLYRTDDGGVTWSPVDLHGAIGACICAIDVLHTRRIYQGRLHFIDEQTGFVAGSSDRDAAKTNAQILMTRDGGATWREVYRSHRPSELIWKMAFPTERIGYGTVMSYDQGNPHKSIVKTIDGGKTWRELPLVDNAKAVELGIGFIDAAHGWVGSSVGGFETRDGGRSFTPAPIAVAANKFRIVRDGSARPTVYAIGTELQRLVP